MDGTLTRTNELIFASFNHVASKYLGKTLVSQEIIRLFGPPEEGGLAELVGEENARAAMDELCEFYSTHHSTMATLHTGIEDVLRFLKENGVRVALFTGKGKRTTTITLEAFNISRYFDLVVSGTDVVNHKPHAEGILKILDALRVGRDEVLMVGDTLSDVKASRMAGVRMAGVVWDSYDRERLLQADTDYVFHNVGEMFEWLRAHIN
jgi:HAD superfamily hydrolase (TIGR01549 family)